MKKPILVIAPLMLAACGDPGVDAKGNGIAATAQADPRVGNGEGTIMAIDSSTGKITLAHGPVAELHWPAMTMGFDANGNQLNGLKVGDKVKFSFRWDGKAGEIESIDKI